VGKNALTDVRVIHVSDGYAKASTICTFAIILVRDNCSPGRQPLESFHSPNLA
jgi:hypothetical protein